MHKVQDKDSAVFTTTLFTQLYVRVDIWKVKSVIISYEEQSPI